MPKGMLDKLPAKAREIYEKVFNAAVEEGKDEATAAKIATGAIKQAGFRKNETTGRWVQMTESICISFGESPGIEEWLEVACTGSTVDKHGRKVSIDDGDLQQWIKAFDENARGQDIPITTDHPKSGGIAAGWVRGLKTGPQREILGKIRTPLLMQPEWTPSGKKSVTNKDYQYFSVEILPENYLRAISLVNFPALKGMKTATQPLGETFFLQEFLEMAELTKCAECGIPVPDGSKACPGCGQELKETEMSEENTLSLEEFETLRTQVSEAQATLTELQTARDEIKIAHATTLSQVKALSETNEQQATQIHELVDLNNMMRLHEKVTDFSRLEGSKKQIAPAYIKPILDIVVLMESTEQEQSFLDLLGAIAKGEALVELGERGSDAGPAPLLEGEDPTNDRAHKKVLKYMSENNISDYKIALMEVSKEASHGSH